jgi:ribosomal protein S18 acetylase RimI-like enzyme
MGEGGYLIISPRKYPEGHILEEFGASGTGILLRPVAVEDSADILEGLLQGGLTGAVPGSEDIKDISGAREMVSGLLGRATIGAELHFSVCLNGKVIGMCALYGFGGPDRSASIGYWISRPYRRLGYGREAVRLLSRIAFDQLRLLKILAVSDRSNEASTRILRSLGFSEADGESKPNGQIRFSLESK